MKLHNVVALLAVALLALGAAQAKADEIKIDNTYAFGSNTGSPSDGDIEAQRLAYHIGAYNNYPGFPPPVPDGGNYETYISPKPANVPPPLLPNFVPGPGETSGKQGENAGLGNTLSVDVSEWTYLMVKWANTSYYYYVGGLTGTLTVTNDVVFNENDKAQEASHYTLFKRRDNGVADGGLTAVLIGLGLAGLGVSRRYLKK